MKMFKTGLYHVNCLQCVAFPEAGLIFDHCCLELLVILLLYEDSSILVPQRDVF